jgi:cell division protein FtsL
MTPPAAAAAPSVQPRRPASPGRRTAPRRHRRVSGPVRREIDARPSRTGAGHASGAQRGLAIGVLAALRGLSRHALLDRLLRGRTWIALVAFALIGIVTLQLGLLKLNASIGRTLQKQTALQRENASLNIENSELSAGDRVESRASRLGMQLVPAGALRFLVVSPGTDASRGAKALSSPLQASSASAEASSSAAAASSESSSAAGAVSQTPAESTGAQAASTPSSTPPPSSSSEASGPSGESSASSAGASSPSSPSSASAPASSSSAATQPEPGGGSSTESSGGASGGTQSGPSG